MITRCSVYPGIHRALAKIAGAKTMVGRMVGERYFNAYALVRVRPMVGHLRAHASFQSDQL